MSDLDRLAELWDKSEMGLLSPNEQVEFQELSRAYPEHGHVLLTESLSLNLLRSCAIDDVEPSNRFTKDTVRKVQSDQKMSSLNYWLPAICGAGVAAAALFALLQLISRPDSLPQFRAPKVEARRVDPARDLLSTPNTSTDRP